MLKNYTKSLISVVAQALPLDYLITKSNQGLILPMYHAVSDKNLSHLKHLYPVISTNRFINDIDFFTQNYKPVSYTHLLQCIEKPEKRKEKAFYLTFDDGLREFYDVVAPILIQKGIPATVFVNPAFVDNKDMFYRLKFSILTDKILTKEPTKGEILKIQEIFSIHGLNYNHPKDLLKIGDKDKDIAEKIAPIVNIDFEEFLKIQQPYLSLQQIQSLTDKGFTIGAHSMTHPYFPKLSEDEQLKETIDSLNWVKEKSGQKDGLFSFPYTDFQIRNSFFENLNGIAELTFGTANLKLDSQTSNFQRIPMEMYERKDAVSIIKNQYLLFILKKLINKHVIIRN